MEARPRRRACRLLVALAALAGCGGRSGSGQSSEPVGSLAPRHDDESGSETTTCSDTLNRVEALAGDLDRGLTAGPIAGFERLTSRRDWLEACVHFSPWVRRCLVLSSVRQELSSCDPGSEPWSRRHDFGEVPPEEKAQFLSCVNAAADRRSLSRCGYD